MKIGIAYALPTRQAWIDLDVPEGTTIQEAIERSGILKQFPEIDLETQKVGIYGKLSKLDAVLTEGDRIEIYRPIICDPKTVPRKAKPEGAAAEAES